CPATLRAMKVIKSSLSMKIPEGVTVESRSRVLRVKGKRGALSRSFRHLSLDIKVSPNGRTLTVEKWFGVHKELAAVRTVITHVRNMIKGVTYGFRYKMKSVYAHFPINMVISKAGDSIEIRNFLGEKNNRTVNMLRGVTVSQTGVKDEIQLDGNDIEAVSHSAALIQQCCCVKNKDIRKFLDGVYVSEKSTVLASDD
ncbi:hypothetical protein BOX15_Mlig026440g3, partial [Macrostomum lignano]